LVEIYVHVKKSIKVLLVDDHKLFREGLTFVISQMEGFEIVGEASNGIDFLEMIDKIDVDVVLMDIFMPGLDGIDATMKALEKKPFLKIIALTMFSDEEYYYKMINAGVSGYILKESGKDELATALNAVASGESYFSHKLLHSIILNINNTKSFKSSTSHPEIKLTPREAEILKLLCEGKTNAEISDILSLSLRTVEGHKSNLIGKTGVKNSVSLVMFALKNHLIDV
jgi:DNA-binding NarL/FixJ family response regulator